MKHQVRGIKQRVLVGHDAIGAAGVVLGVGVVTMRLGPKLPMCRYIVAEPGPPL